MGTKIMGTGSYTPSFVLTNEELSNIVDTNDEWIISRTGIKERRISKGEETSDIGTKAALEAISNSKVKVEDIDLIIFATITGESLTPSMACIVQKNIGAINATAFDINAACSGFIFATSIAEAMIKSGQVKNALIIGAEVLSKIVNWEDRNTCVLFGDGAGAAVISASEEEGVLSVYTKSLGDKWKHLTCNSVTLNNPFSDLQSEEDKFIHMDGREVFKFATTAMVEAVEVVLKEGNTSLDEIKYFIPHQANLRIIDFASKKLGVPMDRFFVNLDRYGNTSAASIPIAFDEVVKSGRINKGDKIILVGFGGGLTYGAVLLEW